jgi:hypothetical protein
MGNPKAPPDWYITAREAADRARALFGLADHNLLQGIIPATRDRTSDLTTEDYLRRAEIMAALAQAGAAVAEALLLVEDDPLPEDTTTALAAVPTRLGTPDPEIVAALRGRERDPDG